MGGTKVKCGPANIPLTHEVNRDITRRDGGTSNFTERATKHCKTAPHRTSRQEILVTQS
jgi:hypothetical protein